MSLHISAQALCPHLRDPTLILLTWYSTVLFSKHCVPSLYRNHKINLTHVMLWSSSLTLDSKLHESRELFILITSVSFHTTGCLVHVRHSINTYWVNEWLNDLPLLSEQSTSFTHVLEWGPNWEIIWKVEG